MKILKIINIMTQIFFKTIALNKSINLKLSTRYLYHGSYKRIKGLHNFLK